MHKFIKAVKLPVLSGLFLLIACLDAKALQQSPLQTPAQDSSKVADDNRLKAKGTITDAATGKPIDGISVSVPGFSAAITDSAGNFTIAVPHYQGALVISGTGYQSKEIALKGRAAVSGILYGDNYNSIYNQVSLPGQKILGNHLTGAVNSVSVNDRWNRVSESASTYLQGRVPGLNAIRRSGTPGSGATLLLRGYNSLFTSSQPLIMVDGILYDNNDYGISLISGNSDNPLANIDLKDVDNITVIKDATAAAYGVKAANGIIQITTARAREQATRIDFAAYGGFSLKPSSIPVLGAANYRTYLSDALGGYFTGLGYSALQTQDTIQRLAYMNDDPSNPNYYRYHYDTDWQKKVLGNSYNQTYYMKVTGGDNIATYGLSVGYLDNKGITNNTNLERYQTRFNADLNLSQKLKGNANLSFVSNEQNLKDQGLAYKTSPLFLALTKSPFLSANEVSEEGAVSPNFADVDILNRSNPAAAVNNMQGINKNYRFLGSLGFNYQFSKLFNLDVLGGVTYNKVRENLFIPDKGIVSDSLTQAIAKNTSGTNVERLYSLYTDTRLSYNQSFNNTHNLSAAAGFRFNDNRMETDYGYGFNSATDDYVTVGQGQAALRRVSGDNGKWRWLNMYLSSDYNYLSKYFLTFNMAVDGSSRFGKDVSDGIRIGGNSFAVLPSLAAGWLVSSEEFMANTNWIDVLKLRGSFGYVGNDDIGNSTAKQLYVSQNFLGAQGLVRANIPNTSLKWETVRKVNAGVDAAFLKERLNITFDLFNNRTSDMLIQESVRTITGFDYAFTNNGSLQSSGAELGLNGRVLNKTITWDLGLNLSAYKTKVLGIPGDRLLTEYAGASILTQKGMEGNLFYGYKSNGVYASSADAAGLKSRRPDGTVIPFQGGDVRFSDLNSDGFIDEDDRQVIGNPNPDFTGMLYNTLSWKRFSLDAMFTFSAGNEAYNFVRRNLESMDGTQNQTPRVLNRWRYEGQATDVPRAAIGDPAGNARFSDRWIEDASYFRLRTLSVVYSVPLKGNSVKSARVYLSGNNIFTVSKYLGYDPEFSAGGSVFSQGIDTGLEPQFRTIQLGVRIGL